ncbi:MAG: outer membrane beta-barrel protein [Lutibacter sp.]
MKKIFTLLTLILTILSNTYSQNTFGIKANIGFSSFSSKYYSGYSDINLKDKYSPSGQLGVYYQIKINNTYSLGTELIFQQIEGEQETKTFQETNNNGILISELRTISNFKQHISYIGIPIYLEMIINKLNLNLGVQANYVLGSSGKIVSKGYNTNSPDLYNNPLNFDNEPDVVSINTQNDLNITNFDYGLRIGITSNITQKLSFEANYYFGLNNIIKDNSNFAEWKIRQMTVGIRYSIFSTD